ncbi:MAG: cyclase family protein [Gammaproteobacteria bacterium]
MRTEIDLKNDEIIDISPLIHPNIAVFPGDTPFSQKFLLDMRSGNHLTLSSFQSTAHLGAHTDAPNHYSLQGESIEKRPLDYYIGKAQVIEIDMQKNTRIQPHHLLNKKIMALRVLFKTNSFPNPDEWNSDFMSLSAEIVNYLAREGVRLVGIDTPSIDLADDKVLESHHAVAQHNMAILEGIVLSHVMEGMYQLVALPLKILGADATPVRAILINQT